MKPIAYFSLFALLLLVGCNGAELEQLRSENQQLKAALGESNEFADQMNDKLGQIDVLLDSIESAEETLAVTLMEGTSYNDYTQRIRNIQDYIENSKSEISKLEKSLSKSNANNRVFLSQVERLKGDLEKRESRIVELSQQVETYKEENAALIKTVDLQEQAILAQESRIRENKKEMAFLEVKLERLQAAAKEAEANAYFAQGEMQEQLAKKTLLAPKKKKGHIQEAYDYYKKAFEAGHKEAYAKMEALEADLD